VRAIRRIQVKRLTPSELLVELERREPLIRMSAHECSARFRAGKAGDLRATLHLAGLCDLAVN
jgi:hypothetical protein